MLSVIGPNSMITKKLFLASSAELKEDRKEFEIFIGRKNKEWVDKGVFLNLVIWEDFLDAVSQTRLQDEYDKAIRDCDLFVMLFWTKVGQYTEEEFETAFGQFKSTNKPFVFTYFKDAEASVASVNKKNLTSLWAFQEKLSALGHFYTVYKNVDELKFKFNQQLDKLAASGFIEIDPERERSASAPSVQINATVTGGVVGVAGAQNVSIGSLNVGAPGAVESSRHGKLEGETGASAGYATKYVAGPRAGPLNQDLSISEMQDLALARSASLSATRASETEAQKPAGSVHSTGSVEDIVDCSVFGPPAAPPGATVLIQVFLHLASQAERANFLATAMDATAKLKGTRALDVSVKRGARVDIVLATLGLSVDEPVQSVVWRGEPTYCQFLVTIPAGTNGQSFFAIVRVSVDGKLIGPIKFRLSSDESASRPTSEPLGNHANSYKYAFVSYAAKDRMEVLKRVQMLEVMKTKFFQDILSLDPGDRWEKKLYENIDHCDLFLLFWSQAAKSSDWVIKEAEYALKRQQLDPQREPDFVPVVLEQNVLPPPSLSAFHFNDRIGYLVSRTPIHANVSGGAVVVAGAGYVHIENLTQYAAPPSQALAQTTGPIGPSPYPGLSYFGPEDASRFFGREQAIQALLLAVAKKSFTAFVGASGSGKSSVVLAGLAPRLEAQGGWRSTYFRIGTEPDKNPFAALARALSPLLGNDDVVDRMTRAQKLANSLASSDISLAYAVGECRAANPGKRILLIADQFEEVFTLVPDEALRNRFIDALIAAFPDPAQGAMPDVSLVLTLRADFVSQAVSYRPFADQLKDRVEYLGPMTRDELRDAIVKPAEAVHVGFEPGLVDTILDDVEKRPGTLPLLQFALREMWGQLQAPVMTRATYDAIGGVEGALAKRAQAIFEDVTKSETDAASVASFRRLFTRLVTLGEGAEDTRRIVGRDELDPDAWALAQKLADEDNRLVVTAAAAPGKETAEVVHEALIRGWPTLVEWVNRDRAFHSWLRQLKQRVDEWRADPEDEATLLSGGPLVLAEEWVARRGGDLNAQEKAFIAASIAPRDAAKWWLAASFWIVRVFLIAMLLFIVTFLYVTFMK
jgi:energy-coupling factor transporter ATP-binding protein EcfA2